MNQTEVGFEIARLDLTADLIYGGLLVGGSLLITYLLSRFLLQRYRQSISWPFLRTYYCFSTPFFLLIIGLSQYIAEYPFLLSVSGMLLPLIGLSLLPLIPIILIGTLHPLPPLNPWLQAAFLTIIGYLLGRAFVFLLHWLAFSNEPSTLNLRPKD